jgi:hypothetical protein
MATFLYTSIICFRMCFCCKRALGLFAVQKRNKASHNPRRDFDSWFLLKLTSMVNEHNAF